MDTVASSAKEESTHVSPQYDSSEEWEIGLGNLIIDLDADLEKDRQDGSGGGSNGGGTSADSSPLRIGKMKIKRKVSTNTAAGPKGSEGTSPRKDNSLLSNEDSSVPTGHLSPTPDRMVKEDKVTKSGGRNVGGGGSSGSGGGGSGPHHKQDSIAAAAAAAAVSKHLDKVLTSTKGSISLTSGDIHHGKYSSSQEKDTVDNNICRIKTSVDHKPQTVCKKEKESTGGGRKKEEKEGKGEPTGKKGGDGSTKKHGGKKRGEKASSNSVAIGTSDAETLTEPECLGPCEPGTSVNLEGIVWHETDQGVLVVNVTWRNKTYVGTLLDCSRHDWAPPRFCDSPTSDIENRSTKPCGRPKRGRASNNSNSNDMSNFTETRSSIHSKLRNASALKGRKGNSANGNRTPPGAAVEKPQGKRKHRPAEASASSGDDSKATKRLKTSAKQNVSDMVPETPSGLIECPEPNCNKKYKHINGLRYHRQHAHQEDKPEEEEEDQDSENKSSSDESSIVSAQTDIVKSKSDWSDSNRTSGASTNDTKATTANVQVEQTAEKRQLQYSTAAANAAATAAANAAAASMELLHSKEDAPPPPPPPPPAKGSKGHKQISSDKTSPKLLHGTLGKSKDSTPVKSKGDSSEKSGGKHKKGHSSTEKDLSVFDFNSAVDSDGVTEPLGSDKHVSVIRPTADVSSTSPLKPTEPIASMPSAPAKLQDVIHTTPLPGSEHMEELQKHSKKSDKDKSKSGDRKKGKHDKVPSSKVKPTRPMTSSPTPPQLVAIPANVAAKSAAPGTTQPPKMPAASTKQPVNPALKPIQPKPAVLGETTANPPVTNPKEKKSKSKKKSKDKDKEREKSCSAKDKESKDLNVANNKQSVQPQQVPVMKQQQQPQLSPAVPLSLTVPKQTQQPGTVSNVLPETNILHQALTASGIGPEDAERNSPSVTNSGEVPKTDPNQTPKDQSKDVRPLFPSRPPVHGSMPEIPKLIPTSSVVNSGVRSVNAVQGQLPPHQVKPIQPVQDNSKIEKSALPLPQIKTTLMADNDASTPNTAPGHSDESRARSPAYSDISDANEDSEGPAKALNDRDPYSFQDASRNQAKVGARDEHIHSKSLYTPLSNVGRERLPEGMQKAQQESLRTAPPLVQPPKGDAGKEGNHTEGPDAKKPRKDTSSPRLPATNEAGYRSPAQAYSGQYPFMSAGFVMDPQYHMHLFNTDPHYRQQHEQFRQEQRQLAEKERMERERHERSTKDKSTPSKPQEENRERTIPRIKTEPVTPPKRSVTEKGQDRSKTDRPPSGDMLKRKQLDFHKPRKETAASSEASSERPAQEEPARHGAKAFMHQQHQEEMRQYYIYQQKVQEQQKYEEEQRRKLEESRSNSESSAQKEKENRSAAEESREKHKSSRSPSPQCNPPKSRSPGTSSVEERKLRQSPSVSSPSPLNRDPKAAMSSSSSRKVMDYPAYLQHTPYGPMPVHQTPYGPIPIDPNHPAYQHVNPLVYPAYLGHDLRYAAAPVMGSMWKSSDEKAHFEHERSRAISPHHASTSRDASPSDPPPKALDLLQQHASRYYNSQKHDRPRTPEKSRTSSPQRRPASPRKSPEASNSSRERVDSSHRSEQVSATAMVHQHMHTHQHTHVGYPAVLPPYDPFVLASQQAAAAAAAGVTTPYVRRESMPP